MTIHLKIASLAIGLAAAAQAGDYGISFSYSSHTPSYSYSSYSYGAGRPSGYGYYARAYEPVRCVEYSAPRTVVYDSYGADSLGYEPVVQYSTPRAVVYDDYRPVYRTTYTRSDCYSRPRSGGQVSIHYGDGSPITYRSYAAPQPRYRIVRQTRRHYSQPSVSLRVSSNRHDSHRSPAVRYAPRRAPAAQYGWSSSRHHGSRDYSRGDSSRDHGSRDYSRGGSSRHHDSRTRNHRSTPRIRFMRR